MAMKLVLAEKKQQPFTKEVRQISIQKISLRLLNAMKDHIGYGNHISKERLYKKLFGSEYDDNSPSSWMLWEFTKRAMRQLRTRSNCFIANTKTPDNRYVFFVVSNQVDANYYIEQLDRSIKNMRHMQQRVARAARERWHLQKWEIGYKQVNKQVN